MIWKCEHCGTTWGTPLSFDDNEERLDWESVFNLFGCEAMFAMARGDKPYTVTNKCGRDKLKKIKKAFVPAIVDKTNPPHYKFGNSEVIDITSELSFCLGNVTKYVCRAGLKPGEAALDDLRKAQWYLKKEIERLEVK